MTPIIHPMNDLVFKKVFASQEHKEILIALLSALLDFEIEDVHIENPYTIGSVIDDMPADNYLYFTEVDILAQTSDGQTVTIEMQVQNHDCFVDRTQFYLAQAFTNNYKTKKSKELIEDLETITNNYATLRPTYGIFITNFPAIESNPQRLLRKFGILDLETYESLSQLADASTIQACYLDISSPEEADPDSLLYWFVRYLRNQPMLEDTPAVVQSAYQLLQREYYSKGELQMIDQQEKRRATADAILSTRVREGIEQGREEGREEGIEQGIEQGRGEGEERKELELILEMLKNGLSLTMISNITHQPKEDIQSLASEHDLSIQN